MEEVLVRKLVQTSAEIQEALKLSVSSSNIPKAQRSYRAPLVFGHIERVRRFAWRARLRVDANDQILQVDVGSYRHIRREAVDQRGEHVLE